MSRILTDKLLGQGKIEAPLGKIDGSLPPPPPPPPPSHVLTAFRLNAHLIQIIKQLFYNIESLIIACNSRILT